MIHTETVHPSQLRRAMASYAGQGYPPTYGPHPFQPGMMVIVISVPDGAAIPDWETEAPRPRRRWFRVNLPRLARGLAGLLLVVAVVYIAYAIFTDGLPQTTSSVTQATPEPSLWDSIAGALPHGEPVVERTAPAVEMPWDSVGRQIGEGVQALTNAVLAFGALVLLGAVLWFVAKVRGALGK